MVSRGERAKKPERMRRSDTRRRGAAGAPVAALRGLHSSTRPRTAPSGPAERDPTSGVSGAGRREALAPPIRPDRRPLAVDGPTTRNAAHQAPLGPASLPPDRAVPCSRCLTVPTSDARSLSSRSLHTPVRVL